MDKMNFSLDGGASLAGRLLTRSY